MTKVATGAVVQSAVLTTLTKGTIYFVRAGYEHLSSQVPLYKVIATEVDFSEVQG